MNEYGPIYRLAAGPQNFVVVSDPGIAKHVLRNYGKYAKGLIAEVSEFLKEARKDAEIDTDAVGPKTEAVRVKSAETGAVQKQARKA
ncbi:hypothetical protein RJ639_002584 [Escallonia herrerae]|uniref:Uncharacterized protein n=1 Tax=Escallonia herrerae TaxID=1293975 RepID=A0AA88XB76_9ASTE|nr:hypothetical protein RJ639_002584 [Escallonia herrerae]